MGQDEVYSKRFNSGGSAVAALYWVTFTRVTPKLALLAMNLGNDADTTGAIHGQLAAAFYGAEKIPPQWKAKLVMCEFIVERLAE
jgi:ADP-ribosylglycohydrolase